MNLENEIWKDIPGYEGAYQVSNLGRIKSLSRVVKHSSGGTSRLKEKIMKPTKNIYLYARLQKDGKNYHLAVHRLVCGSFHENPNNYPCVNHKDNDPTNNNADNLEWCTHSYNNNYGTHSERLSDAMVEKFGVAVDVYTKHGEFVKSYKSIRDAVRDGYDRNSIGQCCRNNLKSHCGLVFRYKGDSFKYKKRKGNVSVDKYDLGGNLISSYHSIREAADDNGLKKEKLRYMKNHSINTPIGGYVYKFNY